ncbi:hypothetical protein [Micromonospora parva]|uniref:hypothetical protein n=1 Tax=Micromonospora parva TaxID=1464048 RepID=UPI0033F0ACF9
MAGLGGRRARRHLRRPRPFPARRGLTVAFFRRRSTTPGVPRRPAPRTITIRSATPPRADRSPEPPPSEPVRRPDPGEILLVRFDRPAGALSCWARLYEVAAAPGPVPEVRRAPDGRLWLRAAVSADLGAGIAWASGGSPYTGRPPVPVSPTERTPAPDEAALAGYPEVPLIELLAAIPGRRSESLLTRPELLLLVNGPLTNHVIRRAIGAGAEAHFQPVVATRRSPTATAPAGAAGPAVLVRVVRPDGLPRSLVRTLVRLPQAVVGESQDADLRLIVALDHRLPIDPAKLLAEIPPDEQWVLGGAEGGSWSVRRTCTGWFSADELYSASGLAATPALPDRRSTFVPKDIRVQLVRDTVRGGRPDAVLVDESDLDNLRIYLTGRPLGETGYLTPGPGSFLVQEPGTLVGDLPIGRPLRRIGPGGLYVPDGFRLRPAIPASGRQTLFAVAPRTAVVVSEGEVRRFDLGNAVPIWALWAPELPTVHTGLSGRAAEVLRRLDALVEARPSAPAPTGDSELAAPRQAELHRDALIAHNDGDPVHAAGLLQQAGDFAAAARLLETAALQADSP